MSKAVRIGIVGAGGNTRAKHLPGFLGIEGVRVDAVCNRSEESSRNVAGEWQIDRIHRSWQDLVADPELDAVMIGTWPYLHAPISIAALEAGKHVLTEARMAMNQAEAEEMLAASEARPNLVAQVVPSPFTLPWDQTLTRLIQEEFIGELLAVDVFANAGAFLNAERPMTWREDRDLSGLNTMVLGIYYEALARSCGHAASVQARGQIRVRERKNAEGELQAMQIPDHLDVFGELENGASYHIRCSQVTGACPTPNDFLFYGSKGSLRLNLSSRELQYCAPGLDWIELQVPDHEQQQWRVEEEFIGAIRGEEDIRLTSFPEAFKYMRFTQQVHDSLSL